MNYEETVDYIINIPRFKFTSDNRCKSGTDNLLSVMNKLGNPHLANKAIHIAGTNGKGSTALYTKCILNEMGYSVGLFTSPHLIKINERISVSYSSDRKIKNYNISDEEFVSCFDIVYKAVSEHEKNGGLPLSFFEMMFAIAAVYFAGKNVDYVIYETGLGGRLDATNIVKPEICAITSIGLDHIQYLGDTIEKIAYEKAGIIKKDIPIVYNTGDGNADKVIHEVASDKGCKEINVGKTEYIINEKSDKGIDFSFHNRYYKYVNISLDKYIPSYQVDNLMTSICMCSELLKCKLSHEIVEKAANTFFWPGRMEWLSDNVIVDGAHNEDAIERFTESAAEIAKGRTVDLLFAVAGDKDYEAMICHLVKHLSINQVSVTTIDSSRAASQNTICEIFKTNDNELKVKSYDNIRDAFKKSYEDALKNEKLLFCVGSLYLVGSIKKYAPEVIHD